MEYPGAVYHVMCRGDRPEDIFVDDADREMMLATLVETLGRTGWRLHAWVWMRNHYHLLIETPQPNLVKGMTWFQTTYTTRYNARHKQRGHVFGGRYKAVLVDVGGGGYFHTLIDYIHLNPVRAGIVKAARNDDLRDYRWSSLPGYLSIAKRPAWLAVERAFNSWALPDTVSGRRTLRARLEQRMQIESSQRCGHVEIAGQSLQSTLRRGWYFGRDEFRQWLLERGQAALSAKAIAHKNYHGGEIKAHNEEMALQLIEQQLKALGWTREHLAATKKGHAHKVAIASAVRACTTVSTAWLAEQLHMGTPGHVSLLTRKHHRANESKHKLFS